MKHTGTLLAIILFFSISMSNEVSAQDWANLGYYKEANKTLNAPLANENRIVFMGNSITEGWLQFHPEFFANKSYVNRGIGGQTTPQMLLRFKQDVIGLNPAVVVILAGTNDIAGNTGPMTLEEIGAILGITRERVRQIKERALERLRHASRRRKLEAYMH